MTIEFHPQLPTDSVAPRIAVVGSLNADLTVWVPRRPGSDETLHADRAAWFRGGKGANQAVGAARLGAQVVMIGRVGDDEQGRWLRAGLEAEGIDCRHVAPAPDTTGLAVITVDDTDVSIIVAAGANAWLDPDGVTEASGEISAADALLLQGEVGAAAAYAAARIARANQTLVVFNPAPYNDVAPMVVPLADVVIVNRQESAQLQAHRDGGMCDLRPDAVLVETRGEHGCAVHLGSVGGQDRGVEVAAPKVTVRDATGAGDAFAAAFAVSMALGSDPAAAAELAVRAGAAAVTVDGAQPSLPTAAQLTRPSGPAASRRGERDVDSEAVARQAVPRYEVP
ncbi:PfkB family carbohydrate kinase [Candidatus Poriferisodalis sp.]|uniref:PfkB family carbohydrate kinase n=1 Tax=Candidatus Poriferisodalis sp. TaxID=3101277 RepID=UPI003D0B2328